MNLKKMQENTEAIRQQVTRLKVHAALYDTNPVTSPDLNVNILQDIAQIREQLSEIEIAVDDTAPIVPPRRVRKLVRIEEANNPPAPNTFDVTTQYQSDELPLWFRPLQAVIEDDTFTSMTINLGDRVEYRISIVLGESKS